MQFNTQKTVDDCPTMVVAVSSFAAIERSLLRAGGLAVPFVRFESDNKDSDDPAHVAARCDHKDKVCAHDKS
jgi:hypothetical protein